MAFNPHRFGSPSPMPMVMKANIYFDDDTSNWIAEEVVEGCLVKMAANTQSEVINKLKVWKQNNKYRDLDPDY